MLEIKVGRMVTLQDTVFSGEIKVVSQVFGTRLLCKLERMLVFIQQNEMPSDSCLALLKR